MKNLHMKTKLSIAFSLLLAFGSCSVDDSVKSSNFNEEKIYATEQFQEIKDELDLLLQEESEQLRQIESAQSAAGTDLTEDESFVFFVIGDTELNMRGNTYAQLLNWIEHINNIETYNLEFTSGDFEENESRQITKPELLFLAGDINKDRAFGFDLPGGENFTTKQQTNQLFNKIDSDILFFPGNGNHDWDPYQYGDGSYGNNLAGLLSNLGTVQFVRSRYQKAINSSELDHSASFNYDKNVSGVASLTSAAFNYSLVYKGLRFTQLNNFLHTPAAMVTLESLLNTGPAAYFENRTDLWFQNLCNQSATENTPHVVVQHYPINTGDGWWTNYLGASPNNLRKEFLDIFEDAYQPVMFSGHNHSMLTTNVLPYQITDYTAGYFAQGYVTAVKASASKGVYAVAFINLNTLEVLEPTDFLLNYGIPQ
jgi:hypothetical protein